MAVVHGPCPKRTCFKGKGRTFQATFSRERALPSFCKVLATGSCGGMASKCFGSRVAPAVAARDVTKLLRENRPDRFITSPDLQIGLRSLCGYCIHYWTFVLRIIRICLLRAETEVR